MLYIQHIKSSKTTKFQVLTPSYSQIIAIYKLSTIQNYWILSKWSYLFLINPQKVLSFCISPLMRMQKEKGLFLKKIADF